jgi:hypothetical protein
MKRKLIMVVLLFAFGGVANAFPPTAHEVSNEAYNATTWDGVSTKAPSKDAVRDKIEALSIAAGATIDDGAGNGDTSVVWSADKTYDELALKQDLDADLTSLAAGITGLVLGLGNGSGFDAAVDGTDFLAPSRIDDTKGNGDTGYIWSADKVYDQLALKQGLDADLTSLASGVTGFVIGLGDGSGFTAAVEGTDYLAPARIDDTKGNGDTGYIWSADKVYDQLALKQGLDADLTSLFQ